MSYLYSIGYSLYSNLFTYLPRNNNYEFIKIYNNGTLILLKENLIDIHLPTLVIIPGTTGDTENLLFSQIVDKFIDNSFNVIFILQQGQKLNKKDPIPIETPRCVSFVDIGDIEYAMTFIKEKYKNKIFMLGVSFGAVLMKKYLYIDNEVVCGISISSPWNLRKILMQWESSWLIKKLYDRDFTNHYKNVILKNIDIFKKYEEENPKFKIADMLEARDIQEILKFHLIYYNYNSMDDYLADSKVKIRNVKKPVLFIHSKDDPICSINNMPIHKIKEPHKLHITEYGGHAGYIKDIEILCLDWCKSFLS